MQSVIFHNMFIYEEEVNYMKDYMKARQRKVRKGTTLRIFYDECFLRSNICQKITTETEQYIKYTRFRKSTNLYVQKDHIRLNWKDILLVVEVLPCCLHDDWYCKRNYIVWYFGLSRNPGNEFARQFTGQQVWYIVYLYDNLFCFKKKFLPPFDPVVFSEKFYPRSW